MGEVFPLAAGAVVALVVARYVAARRRWAATVGLAIVFGVIATIISGEALESWLFALVDVGLVLLAAVVTAGAVALWQRRSTVAH